MVEIKSVSSVQIVGNQLISQVAATPKQQRNFSWFYATRLQKLGGSISSGYLNQTGKKEELQRKSNLIASLRSFSYPGVPEFVLYHIATKGGQQGQTTCLDLVLRKSNFLLLDEPAQILPPLLNLNSNLYALSGGLITVSHDGPS